VSEWKSADIVTTTYGTIKKAQQESFDEGVAFERDRIIKLLDGQCKCGLPDEWHPAPCSCQEFIALIKGENK
jgi:hypothetical protein